MVRVTMEDVAREAGVSRALVSIAYRGVAGVSAATRERILAAGESLGYVPNHVAAQLAAGQSRSLGLFLQDLHNDFFAAVHDGIRGVTEEHGDPVVLAIGSLDGSRDASSLMTLSGERVGVVIGVGLQLPDADAQAHSRRTPLVSVARHIPEVDSVYSDNLHGARFATEHLLALGHRRIAFLANPPGDGYHDRLRGYEKAMRSAGLSPRSVVTTFARADVAHAAGALLDGPDAPTALLAHNDQAAIGVLDALAARGLCPGIDVSVIGYDNSASSSAPGVSLTTVDLYAESLGREAAIMARRRLAHPEDPPLLSTSLPDLVIRATTGPVPE